MSPGTWKAMAPANISSTLGQGTSTGNMIPYCNAGSWNPVSKRIEILGQDHGWGNMRHVQYDEASNAFLFAGNIGTDSGHGYDHYEVNPFTGDLFYKPYQYGTGGSIWRRSNSSGAWNRGLSTVPTFQQVALGTCWWKGPLTGGGAQGAFLIYSSAFGNVVGYNPVSNTWFDQAGPPISDTYHSVMAYSESKNVAVFGGGNAMPRRLWRMDSSRNIVELSAPPSGCSIGIYKGGLCCDPATGNFLVLSGGNLFQLDASGSGTWTQLTGSRVPPSEVNNPTATENMIMCELPDHGAIAVISMNVNSGNMYLYRHA
jgi:hypothetical protein